jgi:gluconate 2-dehydrogenase gamma chain
MGSAANTTTTGGPGFLSEEARQTLAAAMARIIPTDRDPGAREAGAIDFLDSYLSGGVDRVWAKPDGSGFVELTGKHREVWARRVDEERAAYAYGVEELDCRSREAYGAPFRELPEPQQDAVLTEMERGSAERVSDPAAELTEFAHWPAQPVGPQSADQSVEARARGFFQMLVMHTRQGFYADPIYGGNRGHAGWDVIGFHGPRSLEDAHTGRYTSMPWFAEAALTGGEDTP